MKKNILVFAIICITVISSGCVGGNMLRDRDTERMKRNAEQIINAINAKDTEILKNMFSVTALSEATNLDEQIDTLFLYIDGTLNVKYDNYGGSITGSHNKDGKPMQTIYKGFYSTDNGKQYMICFLGYHGYENPDDDGIYMIKAVEGKYEKALNISMYSDVYAGIYVPTKEEIDSITK